MSLQAEMRRIKASEPHRHCRDIYRELRQYRRATAMRPRWRPVYADISSVLERIMTSGVAPQTNEIFVSRTMYDLLQQHTSLETFP